MTAAIGALTILVGAMVLWANPRRRVNQLTSTISLHVSIWMLVRHMASVSDNSLLWIRMAIAIGALFPVHFWIFLQSITSQFKGEAFSSFVFRSWRWLTACAVLATLPFSEWFIPSDTSPQSNRVGVLYFVHFVGLIVCYIVLIYYARRISKNTSGVEKLELNVILFGGATAAIVVLVIMLIKRFFGVPVSPHLAPVIVLLVFVGLCYAITTRRIFDAKYLLMLAVRASCVFVAVVAIGYCFDSVVRKYLGDILAVTGSTGVALLAFHPINRFFSRILRLLPRVSELRTVTLEVVQRSLSSSDLDIEFRRILQAWSQSEEIGIYSLDGKPGNSLKEQASALGSIEELLKSSVWLTPGRLIREKWSEEREAAARIMSKGRLGVIIYCQSSMSKLLVSIGDRPSRRPFTYPEVQFLLEIVAIMEASYSRCLLVERAHDAERLATVGVLGAGVAHEIRNPLVTIKAFMQLLPSHYHSEEFRSKFTRLIGDEIGRIETLTEQLMDLASPRRYVMETLCLHVLLTDLCEMLKVRARDRAVAIECCFEAEPDQIQSDAGAVRQIVLNLCINAMQAQEGQDNNRMVRISTKSTTIGVELAVSDNGPGIHAEARKWLFQSFQTTKSTGIGLGLAICGEIVRNINAKISVDNYVAGQGAIFRVVFPCQQSSS